jgi:hypothetical protein
MYLLNFISICKSKRGANFKIHPYFTLRAFTQRHSEIRLLVAAQNGQSDRLARGFVCDQV